MKNKEFEININASSLKYLLEELKSNGFKEKDFDKILFGPDYGDCYYEGDSVGIKAYFESKN